MEHAAMAGENDDLDGLNLDPPPEDEEQLPGGETEEEPEENGEEQEPEDGDEPDQGEGEPPPPRRTERASRRITAQQETILTQRRELEDLRQRVDQMMRQQNLPPQGETPQQREQRFALLSPEERIREEMRESEHRHTAQLQMMQFNMMDTSDKAAFDAKAAVDPFYRKWGPRVEAELAKMRNHPDPRQRSTAPRENLLYYLVGRAAIEARSGGANRQQKRAASARVEAQRTRPGNARSDQPASRRQQGNSSLERRLENVNI
jgi:hypothetical protein